MCICTYIYADKKMRVFSRLALIKSAKYIAFVFTFMVIDYYYLFIDFFIDFIKSFKSSRIINFLNKLS